MKGLRQVGEENHSLLLQTVDSVKRVVEIVPVSEYRKS